MDKKDYDLLQDGDDWTVMEWDVASGCWRKSVTFHYDSWGEHTEIAAKDHIMQRRLFTTYVSVSLIGNVVN